MVDYFYMHNIGMWLLVTVFISLIISLLCTAYVVNVRVERGETFTRLHYIAAVIAIVSFTTTLLTFTTGVGFAMYVGGAGGCYNEYYDLSVREQEAVSEIYGKCDRENEVYQNNRIKTIAKLLNNYPKGIEEQTHLDRDIKDLERLLEKLAQ